MRSDFLAGSISTLLLVTSSSAAEPLPAFPGAEGFGRFAAGGRGKTVYCVTNLNDSGPGSFRDAVSKPDRTVVFGVAGVIPARSRIPVSPRITIAGQTAPGHGITIYGNGLSFTGADDTIARHFRIRMGIRGDAGSDAISIARGRNMIFDHVSVSWGRDENFSINGAVTNITIQNCIIAQGLHGHSAGGLIQTGGGVSILRTLYIDNDTRNPKVKGVNQYVNNVVYNWGRGGCYILGDSAGPSHANVQHNYFIAGPNSAQPPFIRGNENFRIFADGNFFDGNRNGILDGMLINEVDYGVVRWQEKPFDYPTIATMAAEDALEYVLMNAGASLHRDEIDRQLIAEVLSFGKLGQIITNELAFSSVLSRAEGPLSPRLDTDSDGMPDDWERRRGLNPEDPHDRNRISTGRYTELEVYLNECVSAAPSRVNPAKKPVDTPPASNQFIRIR